MDYYKYFDNFKDKIDPSRLVIVRYDDLVASPENTIRRIYDQFGFNISNTYAAKLKEVSRTQKKYKSVHNYSLEQFGMTEEHVYDEIGFIFEKYDLGQPVA